MTPYNPFDAFTSLQLVALLATLLSSQVLLPAAQKGTVVSWGDQVLPYVLPGTRFTRIAAGWAHNLALNLDGTVVAWGVNSYG